MNNKYQWEQEVLGLLSMIHATLEEMKDMMKGAEDAEAGTQTNTYGGPLDHERESETSPDQ